MLAMLEPDEHGRLPGSTGTDDNMRFVDDGLQDRWFCPARAHGLCLAAGDVHQGLLMPQRCLRCCAHKCAIVRSWLSW